MLQELRYNEKNVYFNKVLAWLSGVLNPEYEDTVLSNIAEAANFHFRLNRRTVLRLAASYGDSDALSQASALFADWKNDI